MNLELIRTELTVLRLAAGDVLAVRLPATTGVNAATAVHHTVKAQLPPGVKLLTFLGEVGLDIIQTAPDNDTPPEPVGQRRGKRGASDAQSQL